MKKLPPILALSAVISLSCAREARATSCAPSIAEKVHLHSVETLRNGEPIDPAIFPRKLVTKMILKPPQGTVEVPSIASIHVSKKEQPLAEDADYFKKWLGRKTTRESVCPGVPFLVLQPGVYGRSFMPQASNTGWMKDATFRVAPDRKSAEHLFTQDGVRYSARYNLRITRISDDYIDKGCQVVTQGTRFGTVWTLMLFGLVAIRRR